MKKAFLKNPCNIYLFIWCLYEMKGTLYDPGSFISQGLMLIIMLLSLNGVLKYYQHKFLRDKKSSKIFKGIGLLLVLSTIYGIILFLTDGFVNKVGPTYYYLQSYFITFLPIYTCYVYARKGDLTIENLTIWIIIFIVVGICQFYYSERMIMTLILEKGINSDNLVNNAGYIMLALIPGMLVFSKKPIYMFAGIGVCAFFVIMSMKRGAMLIAAISIILIIIWQLRSSKGSSHWWSFLLIIIGCFALYRFIGEMIVSNDFFLTRIEGTLEGDSSERDIIYKNLLDIYKGDFSIIQQLFGVGAMGTVKMTGMYAHNDWIEILFDQGVIGILVFFYYWICFFKTSINKSFSELSRFCIFQVFVIYSIKTLFSMSIGGMSIFVTSVLGFAIADGFAILNSTPKEYT